jgi:hypothetical protein
LKGAVAFLVNIDVADKVERFNITAKKSQMEKIDRKAKELGMTRSAYIIAAALGRPLEAPRSARRRNT